MSVWRRGWDSNPRGPFEPYRFSRSAPSTTRTPLPLSVQYTNGAAKYCSVTPESQDIKDEKGRCNYRQQVRRTLGVASWPSPAQRCRIAAVVQRLLVVFALGVEIAAAARGAELVLEPLLLVAGGLASGGYGVAQR